jgi:hypothetical protein
MSVPLIAPVRDGVFWIAQSTTPKVAVSRLDRLGVDNDPRASLASPSAIDISSTFLCPAFPAHR